MIDIHTHLIPNVDDGADSIDETLRLAQAAVDEGITHTILTPHHNRYWVINEKDAVLEYTKEVEQAIQEAGIPLTVSPCHEIRNYMLFNTPEGKEARYLISQLI